MTLTREATGRTDRMEGLVSDKDNQGTEASDRQYQKSLNHQRSACGGTERMEGSSKDTLN